MSIIIQAKKGVTPTELVAFLTGRKDCFKYLMVSDWREIDFVTFAPTHHRIPQSDRGRAFGETSELRWRCDEEGDNFICRWMSETMKLDDWGEPLSETFDAVTTSYLLWGEPLWEYDAEGKPHKWQRDPKENRIWYQARIPRALTYPVPDTLVAEWENSRTDRTPLVLRVCEYQQNEQTMFERFIGLDRYESDNKEHES